MLMKTYENEVEQHSTAYVFEAGKLVKELATPMVEDGFLCSPGHVQDDTWATFDAAVEEVMRIAPWVKLIMAPNAWRPYDPTDDGYARVTVAKTKNDAGVIEHWQGFGGRYQHDRNLVIVTFSGYSPQSLVSVALHEAFHAVDFYLSAENQAIIDAGLGQGLAEGLDGPGRYWSLPMERRARAFEAWAANYVAGFPRLCMRKRRPGDPQTFDEIMHEVYTGKMAERIMTNAKAA